MKALIKPQSCENIQEIRDAIDTIDQGILQLFVERLEYVKEIVKFKRPDEEGIIARDRKEEVLKLRKEWAKEGGLDPKLIEDIFRLVIDKNIEIQLEINNSKIHN